MLFVRNFPFFSIFLPIVCAIVCLPLRGRAAKWVTLACMSALIAMSAAVFVHTARSGKSFVYMMGHFPAPFGNELRCGPTESFMALLFCCVSLFSVSGGLGDLPADVPAGKTNYFFIMHNMLIGAMLAMVYTNDLFTAYVFIEIITLSACSIVSAKKGGRTLAASLNYLIMSVAGSCLLLLSIAILYSVTGHLLMPNLRLSVAALFATGQYTMPLFVLSGLMTVGLSIKSALFPFHSWLPDAHASATTSASSVLSGLIIKCYLMLLIKLEYRVFGLETMELLRIPYILLAFGAAGIVYGSWKAIRQKDIKRMLSYSSITQVGYISVAMSLNTSDGMAAACFHIAVHAIGKAMLFTAVGGLTEASGRRNDYSSLLGAARRAPLSGAAFILGGLTMAGIPPFPGFASKLYLTLAALETPFAVPVVIVVVIAGTILGFMFYFPAVVCILSKGEEHSNMMGKAPIAASLSRRTALVAFISLTLFLGLFSPHLLSIITRGLAVFA